MVLMAQKKKKHTRNITSYTIIEWESLTLVPRSSLDLTGPDKATLSAIKNGAIVVLYCICSIAFIGTIDSKRGQFTGGALSSSFFFFFFFLYNPSLFSGRTCESAVCSFFISPPSLPRSSISNVISSPVLPLHADPIWASDVRARHRVFASVSRCFIIATGVKRTGGAHVCACVRSNHNPLCFASPRLSPAMKTHHRNQKAAANA